MRGSSSTPKACVDGIGEANSIIHAAGVSGWFSIIRANGVLKRVGGEGVDGLPREACELMAEILEVIRVDAQVEHFLDHR